MALRPPVGDRELGAFAEVVGLVAPVDRRGAGILRSGRAVLVGLPALPAVARVDADPGIAARQVVVARRLAAAGVPAARLLDGSTPGGAQLPSWPAPGGITVWRWERAAPGRGGHDVSPGALGRLARELHERLPAVPGEGPPPALDPLGAVADQLAAVGPGADADLLAAAHDRLAAAWSGVVADDPLGWSEVVHGDLHAGNVLATPSGPVLLDLELAGSGPRSYDVVPQVVAVSRYGRPAGDLDAFLDAYGADPRPWPGLAVLIDVYELWVTAWSLAHRDRSPAHEREATRRLRRWRGTSVAADEPWTLL